MKKFTQSKSQQKHDFKYSVIDGAFWTIMTYLSSVFLVPYLLILGANSFQTSLISYVPTLIAAILSFFSYDILKYFNSKKQMVVFFVILQSLFWFPLAFVYFFVAKNNVVWVVLGIYFIIAIIGAIPDPVYRAWIGKIFKINEIGVYNAKRNIVCNIVTIIPLIFAASMLDAASKANTLYIFTVVFIFAGVSRFISGLSLNRMSTTETKEEIKQDTYQSKKTMLKSFLQEIKHNKSYFYFFSVVLLYYFSVYVTSPYNKYYLLKIINLSYTQYITIEIISIIGIILTLLYWGPAIDKFGATKVLKVSMFFLPLYPIALIFLSKNYYVLAGALFIDIVLTAGLGIALTSYIYQNVKKNLIAHMTFLTLFQSIALTIGALSSAGLNHILSNRIGTEAQVFFIIYIIGISLRVIVIFMSQKLKDNYKAKSNLLKEMLLFKPITHGSEKLLQVIGEKQKKITKNVAKKRRKLDKKIKKSTKKLKKDVLNKKNKLKKKIKDKIYLNDIDYKKIKNKDLRSDKKIKKDLYLKDVKKLK